MLIVIILLSLALAYLTAYTMAMQGTTLALGRFLAGVPKGDTGTGVQRMLTPRMQTIRNYAMFVLILIVFSITTLVYAWHYGIVVVFLCLAGGFYLGSAIGLQPGSPEMVAAIVSDLERRRDSYRMADDSRRLRAMEELLGGIRSISRIEIGREGSE